MNDIIGVQSNYVFESFGPEKRLYKYYSNVDYAVKALSSGNIHLDDPLSYNDPFEPLLLKSTLTEKEEVIDESKYKISCFCETYTSILMWSYYSNCHKGVCLEFDIEKLIRKADIYEYIRPVHYSSIRPKMDENNKERRARCFLTKAEAWAHEHEWRIISNMGVDELSFDCVSAVYLGVRIDHSRQNVQKLIKMAKSKEISVYQGKLDDSEYKLNFSKC